VFPPTSRKRLVNGVDARLALSDIIYLIYILSILFIALGCFCIALAVHHEYIWFRRRKGRVVKGVALGNIETDSDGPCYSPEVEYCDAGEIKRFVSAYGRGKKWREGTSLDVILTPDYPPEIVSWSHRFFALVSLFVAGGGFILLGCMALFCRDENPSQPVKDSDSSAMSTEPLQ